MKHSDSSCPPLCVNFVSYVQKTYETQNKRQNFYENWVCYEKEETYFKTYNSEVKFT
jgi:hypothetical protein